MTMATTTVRRRRSDCNMMMMKKRNLLVLLLAVIQCLSHYAFAVDRSKFRTCEQTSFCRRHRDSHSASLYKYYKLEKDSMEFHNSVKEKQQDGDEDKKEEDHSSGGGIWHSLSHRLLSTSHKVTDGKLDPYVRGPPPTLTGILTNTAAITSSGLAEHLSWSLSAMNDGMVRMRVTEVYGKSGSKHEKARVTYDELVLKDKSLHPAHYAEWIRPTNDENKQLLSKLLGGSTETDLDNFMALRYGTDGDNNNNNMIVLIRLNPLSLFLFSEPNMEAGPIMTVGDRDMMHFEVRREQREEEKESAKEEEEEDGEDHDETKEQEKKPKEEKEIVGYWEDGLAIYADGTREERHEKESEEEHHRMLQMSQAELDREGLWEEHFSSHVDSKPNGPMSVGMDITFASKYLFGLPEHASSTQLQTTMGDGAHYKEPYRLYNLDVFEYELDETMALYGHVPLIVSQSVEHGTAGVFWFNPTETYVDVLEEAGDASKSTTTTHWMSESGVIDLIMLPGPSPQELYKQYGLLTGTMPLPPMFSLGYHQCRWNYKDEKDVYHVHSKFEELDYPYDVLWLDIEHTDDKRYFTWDDNLFPNPAKMQETLKAQGRNMVTIVDPHIKRDDHYYIHKEATSKGLYIKQKDGHKDYDGWCWPGSSSYLDFTSENVRNWWAQRFSYKTYKGSTPSLYTWNDMNEPSVFNGPEVSMQKDLLNLAGDEHREWHNLYGMLFHRATSEGLVQRNPDHNVRPFVLSRAFFAGSQQYGAIWTGDNAAEWSHLEIAAPMLLSMNVAALSFVGADVGGFFGNPDAELFTRWMQAGAYTPFFRGHAHHDSKRREPWMFGDETLYRLRAAAMARYALLPYWYTVFYEAGVTGMPVMRMMWMQYPQAVSLYGVDDQWLVGSDLLVKPVTAAGVTETTVLFPTADIWYDVDTMAQMALPRATKDHAEVVVPSDIDKIPVYQRGGSIIPRKLRLRRSSNLMKTDPYTLYVALDKKQAASGKLYMDDEETFDHQEKRKYGEALFSLENNVLSNKAAIGQGWIDDIPWLKTDHMIERIVIMGMPKAPKSITDGDGGNALEFEHDKKSKILVIRKPNVSALEDWGIYFK